VPDDIFAPLEAPVLASSSTRVVAGVMPLFAVTLFASALLLFCVQPLFVKLLLPLLGGSPGVWNTAMVFFQGALLAGYAYAHLTTRFLPPRGQVLLHLLLLAVAVLALPIGVAAGWSPPVDRSPIAWLLAALGASIGLPFFVVSASAPLLQRWFSASGHPAAQDPYFLYGASNAGSVIALLAYPLAIEPLLPLAAQSALWSLGYALLACLVAVCGLCLLAATRPGGQAAVLPPVLLSGKTVGAADRACWIALAAIPSSLLLGVSAQITTDIVSAPLLWVMPLALYLLSFILVFARRPPVPQRWMVRALPYLVILIALSYAAPTPVWLGLLVPLMTGFVASMICHGELVRRRPSTARLTEFYLCMSFGGMLGGLFNAVLAPLIFNGIYEFPIALLLCCLVPWLGEARHRLDWRDAAYPAALLAVLAIPAVHLAWVWDTFGTLGIGLIAGFGAIVTFSFRDRPVRFALGMTATLLAAVSTSAAGQTLLKERSFFGVHKVQVQRDARIIALLHGTTIHGMEFAAPAHWREPLAYYHPAGPAGQFFAARNGKGLDRVGVVGLGAGALNCYRQAPQAWTYFEIDPAVVQVARDSGYFHFLAECGADTKIVLGDARLSLQRVADGSFDLLVLDAFSSDAIPMHLLTREALALYLAKLGEGGVILLHISNRYLDLAPVVANLVGDAHAVARHQVFVVDPNAPDAADQASSEWVAIARQPEDLALFNGDPRWQRLVPQPGARLWTDDYSNLVGALKGIW
jgi:hypothetical protein